MQLSEDLQTYHEPWLRSCVCTRVIYSTVSGLSFSFSTERFPEPGDSDPLVHKDVQQPPLEHQPVPRAGPGPTALLGHKPH